MSQQDSKKQILKATGILGSVQVINIIIGIIRVKFLAVLLGAAGVGIAGIYQTTIALISSVTGLGLGYSGVRDIAAAAAAKDEVQMSKTVLVLQRWAWITGLLGMLFVLIFSRQLSKLSFGNEKYAWGIAVLSITILFSAVTGGLGALLQGLRKMNALASTNILSVIIAAIGSILIYYYWGIKGIVPALLFTFFISQFITWLFARQIKTQKVSLSLKETFNRGRSMAQLGFFMVVSSLAGNITMYLIRAFIAQNSGLEAVGHFIASWTISSMYISAIFGAMGADYFPRLSAVQQDHAAIKKLVNEQTEVALLLTAPIIIGMISFITIIVKIFYSKDFVPTAQILDWQLMGDFFKVLAWPIGFILLAKATGKLYIMVELIWNGLYFVLVFFGWKYFGFKISGIAFFVAYIVYLTLLYFIVKKNVGFDWSPAVLKSIIFFLPFVILAFINATYFYGIIYYALGISLTLVASAFSIYNLQKIIDFASFFRKLKK